MKINNMNILQELKPIVQLYSPGSETVMYNNPNNEKETMNYNGIVCRIHSDFRERVVKNKSGQLYTTGEYTIDFVNYDEWDNYDNSNNGEADTSYDIYAAMRDLGNSVFWNWEVNRDAGFEKSINRDISPIWRETSNTMTGARFKIKASYFSDFNCA